MRTLEQEGIEGQNGIERPVGLKGVYVPGDGTNVAYGNLHGDSNGSFGLGRYILARPAEQHSITCVNPGGGEVHTHVLRTS